MVRQPEVAVGVEIGGVGFVADALAGRKESHVGHGVGDGGVDESDVVGGGGEDDGVFVDSQADLGCEGEEAALRLGVHGCCLRVGRCLEADVVCGLESCKRASGPGQAESGEWKVLANRESSFIQLERMFARAQRT